MKFAINKKVTKLILVFGVFGLVLSTIVHLEVLFQTGRYQALYGDTLSGIGFALLFFPFMYEVYREAKTDDFRKCLTYEYFPKWALPVWIIAILYFSGLFIISLIGGSSKEMSEYFDKAFWSSGNIVWFLAIIIYNQTILNVQRS